MQPPYMLPKHLSKNSRDTRKTTLVSYSEYELYETSMKEQQQHKRYNDALELLASIAFTIVAVIIVMTLCMQLKKWLLK
jgi:hypothetical protein